MQRVGGSQDGRVRATTTTIATTTTTNTTTRTTTATKYNDNYIEDYNTGKCHNIWQAK